MYHHLIFLIILALDLIILPSQIEELVLPVELLRDYPQAGVGDPVGTRQHQQIHGIRKERRLIPLLLYRVQQA